jgi:hypothetical protein
VGLGVGDRAAELFAEVAGDSQEVSTLLPARARAMRVRTGRLTGRGGG